MAVIYDYKPFSAGGVGKPVSGSGTGTSATILSANANYGYYLLSWVITTNSTNDILISVYAGSDVLGNRFYYGYGKEVGFSYLDWFPYTEKNQAVLVSFGSSVSYYYHAVYLEKYS